MPIQRRSHRKGLFPGLWDISVAGNSLHGEDSHSAAQREVREELGYFLGLSGMRPSMTINFDLGFGDIYPISRDLQFSLPYT